jgi:hypothetical protein
MPCIQTLCTCGESLEFYVPPSMLFEAVPIGTTIDLEERDRLEDPDHLILIAKQEISEASTFLDARQNSSCPTCSRQFRLSDSPGLVLKNRAQEMPVSNMFWNVALILAEEEGWIPAGVRGPFGVLESTPTIGSYLDGNGQGIPDGEVRRMAQCLEGTLPDIPTQEMQTGELGEDPKVTLSGRFRPRLIDLISFLKEGQVTIHRDGEALTMTSTDDVDAFGVQLRKNSISPN